MSLPDVDIKKTQRIKVAGMMNYMDVEYFLVKPHPIHDDSGDWEDDEYLRWKAVRAIPQALTANSDSLIAIISGALVYPAPADVVVYLGAGQKFLIDYEVCTRNVEIICKLEEMPD